jgi:hypothetical protein
MGLKPYHSMIKFFLTDTAKHKIRLMPVAGIVSTETFLWKEPDLLSNTIMNWQGTDRRKSS